MRRPNISNISFKLPVSILLMVVLAVGVTSGLAYYSKQTMLERNAGNLLQAVIAGRAARIEDMMNVKSNHLNYIAERPLTHQALTGFIRAWAALGSGQKQELQRLYIHENPYSVTERHNLDSAQDTSVYSAIHAQYHPPFRRFLQHYGYYDVFLFDLKGNLIYSVSKADDFATNMNDGEWKNSGLAKAYRGALKLPRGEFFFADFAPDGPADAALGAFISQTIFDERGAQVGVISYQLSNAGITSIANLAKGLGETGEIYLVGPDFMTRTVSRFDGTSAGGWQPSEENNEAVRLALEGLSGVVTTFGVDGDPEISAYKPINIFGLRWALVGEKDQSEVFSDLNHLLLVLTGSAALIILLVSALGILFSQSLTRPLQRSTKAMAKIAGGKYDSETPDTNRKDEIGRIATTLETIREKLAHGKQEEFENRFRGVAFEGSAASIMMADADMNITSVNPALLEVLSQNKAEFRKLFPDFDPNGIIGSQMDFYHPPQTREHIRAMLQDPKNLPHTANLTIGDCRFILQISMVTEEDGSSMGYVVEWSDVTKEYLNNAILAAIDSNQVKAEFSMDATFLASNDKFATMIARDTKDMQGMHGTDIFQFDTKMSSERGAIFDRLNRGESIFGEFKVARPDGSIAIVDGGFSPVLDPNDKPIRILMLGNDVTEARFAIKAAEARKLEMEKAQALVVDSLRNGLGRLSEGDLTVKLEVEFGPEYEQLRLDFNKAGDRLLDAMRGVVENADLIRGEASEIANAADDLSSRTERQAATLEETASALDELTSSVRSAADGAAHANGIVANARENAEASGVVVREAVKAMSEIESSSKQISKITGVIEDIAFQTNLLSLNAGVEAARAGDAGRGFAVVASEVRALSQRSSDAAREINELISASSSHVKRGVKLVGQTGEALAGIVKSVSEINQNVGEIAVSAREQSSGLAEINEAVNQLDQVTQQNAAMFEETTAASHALTREAETLTETMGRFQIGYDNESESSATIVSPGSFTARHSSTSQASGNVAATAAAVATAPEPQVIEPEVEDDWDDF